MPKIISLFCLFLTHLVVLSQQTSGDSMVYFQDLSFNSQFEKEHFSRLHKSGEGSFELIMTIGGNQSAEDISADKTSFEYFLKLVQEIPIQKKKSKYYQEIFDQTHAGLLKKYKLENYFFQVFDDGQYNCVSACAIYAMVFDALGVDYVLKETPNHVYLILDPESEQYIVETTDPQNGLTKFSPGFKGSFVESLADSKWISPDEYENNKTEFLFEKYYFNETKLGIKEIVAIQYSNHAVYESRKGDFEEALIAYQKSYFLYPSEKTREALFYVLMEYVAETGYGEGQRLDVLGQMSGFEDMEIDDAFIINEFRKLTDEVFIDQGNVGLYRSYFDESMKTVRQENIRDEIRFIYNYENGRVLHNRGYYSEALIYLRNALKVKPNNSNVELVLITILEQLVLEEKDDIKMRELFAGLKSEFPKLESNNHFGGFYLNSCLSLMAKSYRSRDLQSADQYRQEFEANYGDHPRYRVSKGLIGDAYGQAAVYFFKKGHYRSANESLEKGLEYAPDNEDLKARYRMINQ